MDQNWIVDFNSIDSGKNFVDYFISIGLKEDIIFDKFLYENTIDVINNSQYLKPEINSKFPPINKKTICIDDNLIEHCFPSGYKLLETTINPNPYNFTIILDNNSSNTLFPRKYISCLIFYENIDNYCDAYCKINPSFERNKINRLNIYVPRCICLVSLHPFLLEYKSIIKSIYELSKKNNQILNKHPLEKIIENLVIEVPFPPRGLFEVEYNLPIGLNMKTKKTIARNYKLQQNHFNKLPTISLELEKIFQFLSIEQIFEIYKHIILDSKILFFTNNISILSPIILGFIYLIYPLKYDYQLITIIPKNLYKYLCYLSPYLYGIPVSYNECFFDNNNIDIDSFALIVDIDGKKINYHNGNKEDFTELPKYYTNKYKKIIVSLLKNFKLNETNRNKFIENTQREFFNYSISILNTCTRFFNKNYYTENVISKNIQDFFNVTDFIESVKEDREFYKELIEKHSFINLIFNRMVPKNLNDKIESLFYEENVTEKNNRKWSSRKLFTPFLHSNRYDIKFKYSVQQRSLNDLEINFLREEIDQVDAIKHGQDIKFNNNCIKIEYFYFPKLMNSLFSNNRRGFNIYFFPPNLYDELESINIDIVSKSHLSI